MRRKLYYILPGVYLLIPIFYLGNIGIKALNNNLVAYYDYFSFPLQYRNGISFTYIIIGVVILIIGYGRKWSVKLRAFGIISSLIGILFLIITNTISLYLEHYL